MDGDIPPSHTGRISEERAFRLETPPCPLCGVAAQRPVERFGNRQGQKPDRRWQVVECAGCRLWYTSPRPQEGSMAAFYGDDYGPHRPEGGAGGGSRGWRQAAALMGIPGVAPGRLLDFGCGAGGFLAEMSRRGWDVLGIDASAAAAAGVESRLGLRAIAGSLPHAELAPASFDAITFWQSLEHVHRPLDVLGESRRLLTAGGRMLMSVPNADSFAARWFGADWFGLDLPRHLTHFVPGTLTAMVEAAGFRVEWVKTHRHRQWLQQSALNRSASDAGVSPANLHARPGAAPRGAGVSPATLYARPRPAPRDAGVSPASSYAGRRPAPLGAARLLAIRGVASLVSRWACWIGHGDAIVLGARTVG